MKHSNSAFIQKKMIAFHPNILIVASISNVTAKILKMNMYSLLKSLWNVVHANVQNLCNKSNRFFSSSLKQSCCKSQIRKYCQI